MYILFVIGTVIKSVVNPKLTLVRSKYLQFINKSGQGLEIVTTVTQISSNMINEKG